MDNFIFDLQLFEGEPAAGSGSGSGSESGSGSGSSSGSDSSSSTDSAVTAKLVTGDSNAVTITSNNKFSEILPAATLNRGDTKTNNVLSTTVTRIGEEQGITGLTVSTYALPGNADDITPTIKETKLKQQKKIP